ncbi:MAG: preprotein translocase subunit YajC [Clostridia bacterium]|nr:preprotein translocase subunit YajC [Clostridia bacterium]
MVLNAALLTGAGSQQASLLDFLPSILLFVVLIYFMIIRPQKKRQQNAKNLMASIKVGDRIQTIGGFIGEIVVMEDDEFVIMSEESKLRIKRNAVAIRLTNETAEAVPVVENNEEEDDFNIDDFEI